MGKEIDVLKELWLEREMEHLRETLEEIDASIRLALERLARIDLLNELTKEE